MIVGMSAASGLRVRGRRKAGWEEEVPIGGLPERILAVSRNFQCLFIGMAIFLKLKCVASITS